MTYIPEDLILGRVEAINQSGGKLHYAETGSYMSSGLGNDINQPLANFVRQMLKFCPWNPFYIIGSLYRIEIAHWYLGSRELLVLAFYHKPAERAQQPHLRAIG